MGSITRSSNVESGKSTTEMLTVYLKDYLLEYFTLLYWYIGINEWTFTRRLADKDSNSHNLYLLLGSTTQKFNVTTASPPSPVPDRQTQIDPLSHIDQIGHYTTSLWFKLLTLVDYIVSVKIFSKVQFKTISFDNTLLKELPVLYI